MASTGVIGEPLEASRIAGVLDALVAQRQARRPDGRGARDHDDRHVSEGRDATVKIGERRGRRSTASPRAPA